MTDVSGASKNRSNMAPALGAAAVTVLAAVGAVVIIVWRGGAQRDLLDAEMARCQKADMAACDALRSQCMKRSAEACESLAESLFRSNRDMKDAMRLSNRNACLRGGRRLLEGNGVPKDIAEATRLLDRGCTLGAREACALRETVR
jgi:TPR repeat protein